MADIIESNSSNTSQTNGEDSAQHAQSADPASTGMSEIDKIKAAHAARRSRRARGASAAAAKPPSPQPKPATEALADEDPAVTKVRTESEQQVEQLRQELSNMKLEMGSLRRNHIQNIKQLTESRDMFAKQLAKEQDSTVKPSSANAKKLEDLEAQLRAARTRNSDLESENEMLRDDVKQLNFRVQASKTFDAASDGYEQIVSELVMVKVRCAQLEEEKEELLRMNKEFASTAHVLREANGELEKSRSQWVVQCADIEKQRTELETKLKELESKATNAVEAQTDGSLQDVKLN
ncbi:hypothetical protein BWQ96_01610 [Gracilariopsis chorda]|uniref:Uncharacterized protein n=1 Tax=Gracilariopsis chorda TaxID=448386 RepID=A0A2V3J2X3_9FLOR|nr:hypothetical protein BWQ96_01610 [Gracilariopsis chorda]|eukprot:PXF48758.1 hypothetical protein BWQ96_01610 [Gracilariopsis chorda]